MDRLKELRKALEINQADFASKISVTQGYVSEVENGRKTLSNMAIRLICNEFGVNEKWLVMGEGDMFVDSNGVNIAAVVREYNLDKIDEDILKSYCDLPYEQRFAARQFIKYLSNAIASGKTDVEEIIRSAQEEYAEEATPRHERGYDDIEIARSILDAQAGDRQKTQPKRAKA